MLDERRYEPMTAAQRYAAEREIAQRRREEAARARAQQERSDSERLQWLQRVPAALLMTDAELEAQARRAHQAALDGPDVVAEDSLGGDSSLASHAGAAPALRRKRRRLVYEDLDGGATKENEGEGGEEGEEEDTAAVLALAQQLHGADDDVPVEEGLERIPGTRLADWLALEGPRREVARRFRNFLMRFSEDDLVPQSSSNERQEQQAGEQAGETGNGQGNNKNGGGENDESDDDEDDNNDDNNGISDQKTKGKKRSSQERTPMKGKQGAGRQRKKMPLYQRRINAMCSGNRSSLVVDFRHLSVAEGTLAAWCVDEPRAVLPVLDEAAEQVTLRLFPDYRRILGAGGAVRVRLAHLGAAERLPDLRQAHLNRLVRVAGVVTRRTSVFPQLVAVRFDCPQCGATLGPFATTDAAVPAVGLCPRCQGRGPFAVNTERTVFRNYQKITLQESPSAVRPGRLPRSKDVVLLDDLIDCARPGDEVEVVGVYRHVYDVALHRSHGYPVFATLIEANNVTRREDLDAGDDLGFDFGASGNGSGNGNHKGSPSSTTNRLTPEDEHQIRQLAGDERILERVAASIAPSIFGHSDVKLALALALFGGQTRVLADQGQHRIRGDINVLLLGDPGTAKSQFLKFVEATSHRAVFTTGKGSTAVGLTAAVHKDPVTREWTLEGGALVLADRGVCLIDEFDKMSDRDRTSIHEAMEQQSISISKAGIVTTLQARCAVVAAANPVRGRYDASLPFRANVELTEPILSRFDILLVIRDIVSPVADANLARFVVQSHVLSHPDNRHRYRNTTSASSASTTTSTASMTDDLNVIPQDLLRKYILYARTRLNIQWFNSSDFSKLATIYADMRQEAERSGGFPICMRHVESAMRIAEACARIHLREHVRDSDLNLAIRVMLESFIGTHKYSVARLLHRRFRAYLTYRKDNNELLYNILQTLFREHALYAEHRRRMHSLTAAENSSTADTLAVDVEEFEGRALEMNITECRTFYSSPLFRRGGFVLRGDKIVKAP